MADYAGMCGTTVRRIDGQWRLGFYLEGEWVDLGRAVLAMTEHHEETGGYKIEWVFLREKIHSKCR
jgi:hypothetical protein